MRDEIGDVFALRQFARVRSRRVKHDDFGARSEVVNECLEDLADQPVRHGHDDCVGGRNRLTLFHAFNPQRLLETSAPFCGHFNMIHVERVSLRLVDRRTPIFPPPPKSATFVTSSLRKLSRVPHEPTQKKISLPHLPAFQCDLDPVHLWIGREGAAKRGARGDRRNRLERISAERAHGEAGLSPPEIAARVTAPSPMRGRRISPKATPNPRVDLDGIAVRGCELGPKSRDRFVVRPARGRDERGPPVREHDARPVDRRVDLGLPALVIEACFGGQIDEIEVVRLRPVDLRSGDRRDGARQRSSETARTLGSALTRPAATPRRANTRRAHIRSPRPDREANGRADSTSVPQPSESFVVDHVERKQRPAPVELGVELRETCATLHRGEINETDRAREVCFPTCRRTSA